MVLRIKNMVCARCTRAVEVALEELGIDFKSVVLGEVTLGEQTPDATRLAALGEKLNALGFEIINDRKSQLIEKIKAAVIDLVRLRDEFTKVRLSEYLERNLHKDYSYLSGLFSSVEGTTIEQYQIRQRIERARELLAYDQQSLAEIARALGYSSTAHLSRQFKQVTGLTPTRFRSLQSAARTRRGLDEV